MPDLRVLGNAASQASRRTGCELASSRRQQICSHLSLLRRETPLSASLAEYSVLCVARLDLCSTSEANEYILLFTLCPSKCYACEIGKAQLI